jgi:hypothetical protein
MDSNRRLLPDNHDIALGMGHWRRFLSPRFVNKRGQKTWIAPHINGEGLMPPQIFEITQSKDKQNKEEHKGEVKIEV